MTSTMQRLQWKAEEDPEVKEEYNNLYQVLKDQQSYVEP